MEDINDIMRYASSHIPENQARIGTVCAADKDKRIMKLILQPDGIETGWCKTLGGTFTDEIGEEAVALAVGHVYGQYIVIGIINKPD